MRTSDLSAFIISLFIIVKEHPLKDLMSLHFIESAGQHISEAQRKENYETLDSLAKQLKQHLDCSVIIEGYANNVTNTEKENITELIPLSETELFFCLGKCLKEPVFCCCC